MSLVEKIQEYGIAGSYSKVREKFLCSQAYKSSLKLPVDPSLIVLESEGDLSDNAFALYDYMRSAGYLKKHHVVWAVDDVAFAERVRGENPSAWPSTEFVCKYGDVKLARALATCRWFIYDHNNLMSEMRKREGQSIVFLTHGCGYKGAKGPNSNSETAPFDFLTATSLFAATCICNWQQCSESRAIVTGYPRNDYLLRGDNSARGIVEGWLNLDRYRKVVFWMPTFRQSQNRSLSEDYIRNETGLPLFSTREELRAFSDFLLEQGILLVLKLHHLQAELPIFEEHFKNIVLVRDEHLRERGVQLYQFVRCADALISDYSSISVDYMLLDRPIVYTLDDYEEYGKSRGLFPANAIDYMPGYHVYDSLQLEKALGEITEGRDVHRAARAAIIGKYHTYGDSCSAERVLLACGIAGKE